MSMPVDFRRHPVAEKRAGCPSCRPANCVRAPKVRTFHRGYTNAVELSDQRRRRDNWPTRGCVLDRAVCRLLKVLRAAMLANATGRLLLGAARRPAP